MNLKRKFFIIPFFLSATISAQVPFSGVSGEFILDSKPPEVSVLIPNGGESYFHLDPLMVSWSAQDESFGSNPVSIELSMDGGITYDPVLSGIPNSGTVSIDVTNLLTEHARIRVLAADTFGIANEDASDGDFIISTDFSGISAPFILDSKYPAAIVLTPNGGESVSYSGPMLVTWNASDESFGDKPISIGISTEAGGSYTIAEDSLQNTGFALINAPGVQTEFGKVWVIGTDTFGLTTEDPSDGYFTFDNSFTNISGSFILDSKYPEIAVVSPNGGESFPFAELLPVHWDAFDESFGNGPVSVEISFDGGASYEVIAAALPDLDSALLITPETISDIALIRITVTDTFGLVSNDISDDYFSLIGFKLDLKAFLEGPFILNQMIPFMNIAGVIPPGQPYDIVPWLYHGPESVPAIPNNDVIDWVLLELRDTTGASLANSSVAIDTLAVFIMNDGKIFGTDGASFPVFGKYISDSLFVVVRHRNHLDVMSAYPLVLNGDTYSYDFSIGENQVYGGANAHKELAPGIWGLAGGDGNADGQVNNGDKIEVWAAQAGNSGYMEGDFNLDSYVNNTDKNDIWNENVGRGVILPPEDK